MISKIRKRPIILTMDQLTVLSKLIGKELDTRKTLTNSELLNLIPLEAQIKEQLKNGRLLNGITTTKRNTY